MGRRQTRSKGTLDTLLSIGATFDWISPLGALVQALTHSGGVSFQLNIYAGADRSALQKDFKAQRIETWGWCLIPKSGDLWFYAHKSDVKRVERILAERGL